MKLNGVQYYGLLSSGMLLGILLSAVVIPFFEQIQGNWFLVGIVLLAALPVQIAHLTLLLELWDEFGVRFLVVALGLMIGGILLNPLLIVVLITGPFLYGLFGLWGFMRQRNT